MLHLTALGLVVKQFLAKHAVMALERPPYSPDLSPLDSLLFAGL
jgi:transposase